MSDNKNVLEFLLLDNYRETVNKIIKISMNEIVTEISFSNYKFLFIIYRFILANIHKDDK
jgi:hypothetical protein